LKEEEDFRQDKIVIYNEVLEVLRALHLLFKKTIFQERAAAALGQMLAKAFRRVQAGEVGIGEEPAERTSFTIEKSLVLETWARVRPTSEANTPRAGESRQGRRRQITSFGEDFTKRLL
jgi:hypothetical protein